MRTRRSFLSASASAVVLAFPAILTSKNRVATPNCTLAAEQTEGPYYVDQALVRRDITEGRSGIPLHLQITVLDGLRCKPLANAALNIWHCDSLGIYSGFTANSPDGPPGMHGRPPGPPPEFGGPGGQPPPRMFHHGPSDNTRFFRGIQFTDANGMAEFATIYPGWYMGRDIHIHLKVHTGGSVQNSAYRGGHVCHTGQLFFPEDISDAVSHLSPYAKHNTERTRQDEDDVFTSQHGSDFIVTLAQLNQRSMADGFIAKAILAVNPDAEPMEIGPGGPPPPFPR